MIIIEVDTAVAQGVSERLKLERPSAVNVGKNMSRVWSGQAGVCAVWERNGTMITMMNKIPQDDSPKTILCFPDEMSVRVNEAVTREQEQYNLRLNLA